MTFLFSDPMSAGTLFKLTPVNPVEHKPGFMNLAARRRPGRALENEHLKGAGIYGLFLRDKLFYVGIFSGANADTLAGTVLTRWILHVTYQTLRSPKICFAYSGIRKILTAPSSPAFDAIAHAAGGREASHDDLKACEHPLLEKQGATCTYNKARFASLNWDVFQPGKEAEIETAVSFVFARLDPQALAGAPHMDVSHRNWIKFKWLKPCEDAVIRALKPICNSETAPGTERLASPEDFRVALAEAAAAPLPAYVPVESGGDGIPAKLPEDPVAAPVQEVEAGELDSISFGETAFRSRLQVAGEAWIDELEQICPIGLEVAFVNIPELRVYGESNHRVLIRVRSTKSGKLTVFARVGPCTAKALGFGNAIVDGDWTRFALDCAEHQPSALIALAGAALASQNDLT